MLAWAFPPAALACEDSRLGVGQQTIEDGRGQGAGIVAPLGPLLQRPI